MNNTAATAHAITLKGSPTTYLITRLLVDQDLVEDCFRAYAYFRWADDAVDISCKNNMGRTAFIARQKMLIETLYHGGRPEDLCPEEEMLADLIAHDRGTDSGLRSFIYNFMAVIAFDASRKGYLASRQELSQYTSWLATAVMDGIQYFIGNGHPYPKTADRTLAVVGAHIAHMLRDMLVDLPAGFINISKEDLSERGISLDKVDSKPFRHWVGDQVKRARICLQAGKCYIDSLDFLRCKLAGAWYCARFEWYLNAIERDRFSLRHEYPEQHSLATWAKLAGLGFTITVKHIARRIRQGFPVLAHRSRWVQDEITHPGAK